MNKPFAIGLLVVAAFVGMGNMLDEEAPEMSFVCQSDYPQATCWDRWGNLAGNFEGVTRTTTNITFDENRRVR